MYLVRLINNYAVIITLPSWYLLSYSAVPASLLWLSISFSMKTAAAVVASVVKPATGDFFAVSYLSS